MLADTINFLKPFTDRSHINCLILLSLLLVWILDGSNTFH